MRWRKADRWGQIKMKMKSSSTSNCVSLGLSIPFMLMFAKRHKALCYYPAMDSDSKHGPHLMVLMWKTAAKLLKMGVEWKLGQNIKQVFVPLEVMNCVFFKWKCAGRVIWMCAGRTHQKERRRCCQQGEKLLSTLPWCLWTICLALTWQRAC